jgi:hypothetical protein
MMGQLLDSAPGRWLDHPEAGLKFHKSININILKGDLNIVY